jgi:N-methylhydantoinase B
VTDRFTLDVLREAFLAVADEMFVSLQRTSQSPVIYEVLDFGVGITDARGELVSQGNGIAGFLGPLGEATRATIEGVRELAPGDVIATNDPYSGGGTHLSDVALVRPIFAGERLVAFAAAKGHWTDVGGKDPGSWTADSTEIYQEGLQLPFVRAFRGGRPVPEVVAILRANSRLPDMVEGDLLAQAACLEVAERRVLELCDRYGVDTVLEAMREVHARSESLCLAALGRLPRGVYEAEDSLDDDGVGGGPIPIRARVTLGRDRMVVDLS